MAILRAGPFANSTDSFLDEPVVTPSNFDGATLPVNCANYSGSSDWFWQYLKISTVGSASEFFDAAKDQTTISEDFINPDFGFEGEGLYFSYQAAQDFTITGSYSCDSGEGQGAFSSFIITYYDPTDPSAVDGFVELFEDLKEDFDSGTAISGSFSGELPATVQPKSVSLFFFCDGESSTGSITLNLIAST